MRVGGCSGVSFGAGGGAVVPTLPTVALAPLAQFMASTGVTSSASRVSAWADQSGAGNHATQPTGANQPYTATDDAGRPLLRFEGPAGSALYMTYAEAVTVDLRAHTSFIVLRQHHIVAGYTLALSATATGQVGMIRDAGGASTGVYVGGRISGFKWRMNPGVLAVRSNSGTNALRAFGNYETPAVLVTANTGTALGMTIGGEGNGTLGHHFDLYEHVVYNGVLSDADVASVVAYLCSKYALPTADYTKQVTIEGDSIPAGSGTLTGNGYALQSQRASTSAWRMSNMAQSGSTIATATTRSTQYVDGYKEAGYARNVLFVTLGRNDMGSTGGFQSAATAYANMKTYAAARVAAGWEVWAGTCIATSAGVTETSLLAYNALLTGGVGPGIISDVAGVTKVIDFRSIPQFADATAAANLTYYQADSTHPTEVGAALMAGLVVATIVAA